MTTPATLTQLRARYPDVPEQCFSCPNWNTQYPNSCSRFYSEKQAWAMPDGCPVGREHGTTTQGY